MPTTNRAPLVVLFSLSLAACGSTPPPKVEEPVQEGSARPQRSGPKLQMSQELGSIDEKKVQQTFASLTQGPVETCHKKGRDRVEFLTGDLKVFLRVDGNGKVRYGYFESTTLGDRETEKCVLEVYKNATWPKPEGGEAQVQYSFGWGPGGEREPTSWSSDKVTTALVEQKDVKKEVDRCKGNVKGDFKVTAYVEAAEPSSSTDPSPTEPASAKAKPKAAAAPAPAKHGKKDKEPGGRFKAIGIAPPDKDGAEKLDCIVDALRPLELPSPGSYAAKVAFVL